MLANGTRPWQQRLFGSSWNSWIWVCLWRHCYTLTSTSPEPSVLVFIARFLLSWGCSFQSKFLHIIRGASPQWGEQVTGNEANSAAQVESFSSLQNRILTMCQWMNTFSVPIHTVLCPGATNLSSATSESQCWKWNQEISRKVAI